MYMSTCQIRRWKWCWASEKKQVYNKQKMNNTAVLPLPRDLTYYKDSFLLIVIDHSKLESAVLFLGHWSAEKTTPCWLLSDVDARLSLKLSQKLEWSPMTPNNIIAMTFHGRTMVHSEERTTPTANIIWWEFIILGSIFGWKFMSGYTMHMWSCTIPEVGVEKGLW